MSDVICGAPSLWRDVTCQLSPHTDDRHHAEDTRSLYAWSTAAVEAQREGRCPGCRQFACICSTLCSCGQHR